MRSLTLTVAKILYAMYRFLFTALLIGTVVGWIGEVSGVKVLGVVGGFSFLAFIALFVINYAIDWRKVNWTRDSIIQGHPVVPKEPHTLPAPARALTPDEMIDALYQLSKRQGRDQFISSLGFAIFGIVGGYLAGHLLPH